MFSYPKLLTSLAKFSSTIVNDDTLVKLMKITYLTDLSLLINKKCRSCLSELFNFDLD